MPIYEYECQDRTCGHQFERRMQFKDHEKLLDCPECSAKAKRIISLPSFALKGTGWASDNYKG
jgi:putative FmdB family regulatory protein